MGHLKVDPIALITACFAVVLLGVNAAEAGARRFTYVYEATTASPGTVESENWITWGTSPRDAKKRCHVFILVINGNCYIA